MIQIMIFRKNPRPTVLLLLLLAFACIAFGQTPAPGGPGDDAQWATAGKQGVGTSASLESKVWFTLAQGVMTEVYYPDVTVANIHLLQFVVVDPKTKKVETEQDDAVHQVKVLRVDSLSFQQVNTSKSGNWKITKTYTTDPVNNSVLIDVRFETRIKGLRLYFQFDPSIKNSGMKDKGYGPLMQLKVDIEAERTSATNGGVKTTRRSGSGTVSSGFGVEDDGIAAALYFTSDVEEWISGYKGKSDGLDQLRKNGRIVDSYSEATSGNVVQMGRIMKPERFTTILSFGDDVLKASVAASGSMKKGFDGCLAEYERGWSDYVATIKKVEPRYQPQFNMAAMMLKAHEDKTVRGANIASLTVPWGGGANANENNIGGYHLIWSRDLYQVATAFMALGDRDAAVRAVNFLFKVQQKADGSFPQNSYLDGRPFWESLQLDEVAYPLILAHELGLNDKSTYENHVKKAADFIVRNGPATPQERWEEESGYSPSTIAAEIAGLVCAAEIARKNGDEASATIYLATADDWARKVEMWTATTNGKYGDGNYYLRITQGKPDSGNQLELNNGAGFFDEREIVDAGFLELVRLGIKSPDDPLIAKSLKVIDDVIRVKTPNGDGFYRYNNDGYGEMDDGRRWNWDGKYTGKGRLWTLLSGERGQYELAVSALNPRSRSADPKTRLDAMLAFANDGLMIPEQIWDKAKTPAKIDKQFVPELKFGEGTGSATPLAWSMAQFIRLAVNLKEGRNLDTPKVVYDRYAKDGIPGQASEFGGTDEDFILPVKAGETFTFSRNAPKGTKVGYLLKGKSYLIEAGDDQKFTVNVLAPDTPEIVVVGIKLPNGATAFERVKVISADKIKPQEFSADLINKIKVATSSPLIEDGKVIFFYRGQAKRVSIAGDFSGWSPRTQLQPIDKDLFAVRMEFAPGTRAEYKLSVDGKSGIDELNPQKIDNGVGSENSIFAMSGYKPTEWANWQGMTKAAIVSERIGDREVSVYVPDGLNDRALPVLYLNDGSDYAKRGEAIAIQRNLVKAGKVKPFIIVFLDPKDRTKEYWASDEYAKFVAEDVVSVIDAKYNTIRTRDARAVLGASLGGVTSFWIGLKYPGTFSRTGGQSSSFWVDDERVVTALGKLDPSANKFTFYLDDGILEGSEDSRRVNVLLRGKGFKVTYVEGQTGHNWTAWRDRLADAFVALMN
ncbi:MAG: hypothetical protein IPN69_09470 [Acidobacteria bacterium]|nr:hypothetical protein [Acidobacteriota bacterium]